MKETKEKYERLKDYLKQMKSLAIAFSGGVDSTFLLKVAHDVLADNIVAVTASSNSFPERELAEAKKFCADNRIKHIICISEELSIDGFRQNPPNRCYLCKRELFAKIITIAQKEGLLHVAEGSNTDDSGDYRPGIKAIEELDIKSPLRYAGLRKEEIRELSKELSLAVWDKPSFACLASRFPYGETITEEKLSMVNKAEELLLAKGFQQVRVRIHDQTARIEILPDEFATLMKDGVRNEVIAKFKEYGFIYVALDLTGYRTGSMNEALMREKE